MASTIIRCLSYRNADAMIAWLCAHLGFVAKAVYRKDANLLAMVRELHQFARGAQSTRRALRRTAKGLARR